MVLECQILGAQLGNGNGGGVARNVSYVFRGGGGRTVECALQKSSLEASGSGIGLVGAFSLREMTRHRQIGEGKRIADGEPKNRK